MFTCDEDCDGSETSGSVVIAQPRRSAAARIKDVSSGIRLLILATQAELTDTRCVAIPESSDSLERAVWYASRGPWG